MNQPKPDYMDIGTPRRERGAGSGIGVPLLFAVLACVGGGAAWLLLGPGRAGAAAPGSALQSQAEPEDLVKRQLSAFVERFLLAYYNFSYGLYDDSVARAEVMMTPAFQAAYNQRSQDLEFKRKLRAFQVSTDAIRILPGSIAYSNEGPRYFVRLAGTMTYTTGVNGVSGEFPLTLLLAVVRTDGGFLVDNVERLR